MKRVFSILVVLLLSLACCLPCFAALQYSFTEEDILADRFFCDAMGMDDPVKQLGRSAAMAQYAEYLESIGGSAYVHIPDPDPLPAADPAVSDDVVQADAPDSPVVFSTALLSDPDPAAADSGLRSLMGSIFGVYQPNSYQSVVQLSDGTAQIVEVVPSGAAGVDWQYVGGVFLFGVMLYCIFRLFGAVLK